VAILPQTVGNPHQCRRRGDERQGVKLACEGHGRNLSSGTRIPRNEDRRVSEATSGAGSKRGARRRAPIPLFVDHVSWALSVHMCRAYGAVAPRSNGKRAILTLRQERMIKAAMDARLGAEVTLTELADLCGLSVQYFARAFAGAVGMPPYRWLQLRRLNRAASRASARASLLCTMARTSSPRARPSFTAARPVSPVAPLIRTFLLMLGTPVRSEKPSA
jgi:AraC-like DNA-binding protein